MNKIIAFIIICCISMNIEVSANPLTKDTTVYYWFYVKLSKSIDRETKSPKLLVKKIGKDIEKGNYDDFVLRHKTGLKSGLIMVGPFTEEIQVKNAMQYYQHTKIHDNKPIDSLALDIKDSIYCFYMTRPLIGKWFKPSSFQRIPARIAIGTQKDYQLMLNEGLGFQFLAIGPFLDFGLAEKSKFIFRKNGEPGSVEDVDSIKPASIADMAKKWKSVKIEMLKLTKKKYPDKVMYRIKIKFPKGYFVEDAFQTLTIKAKYSDPKFTSNTGTTFQGDYVMDNNEVIPFDKITTFTQTYSFKVYKKAKLEGFYIESFIFNSTEMIDQETKYVGAKN